MRLLLITCWIITSMFFWNSGFAQYWSFGVKAGGMGYIGDLNPNNLTSISSFGVAYKAKYSFDSRAGIEVSYLTGQISASDAESFNEFQQIRNLSFSTFINEISVSLDFNYFKYIPSLSQARITPYNFLGFGVFNFNPRTTYQGTEYKLVFLGTEGQDASSYYKTYAFSFIYGVGIRYNIFDKFTLQFEIGYRTTTTDFIDDVSGLYPERSELRSDIAVVLSDRSGERNGYYVGVPNSQRGDMRPVDHYFFTGISVSYAIIPKRCFLDQ